MDFEMIETKPRKEILLSDQQQAQPQHFIKVSLPADFNSTQNNLALVTASPTTSNTNHTYSLQHNTGMSQPILVTGPTNQQNKIILNTGQSASSVLTNASNLTLPTPTQELLVTGGGQNKLLPTSNIKVNLIPTTNNQQDVKSFITSSLHHPSLIVDNKGNLDVKTLVAASSQQQLQNRMKVEKMIYDTSSADAKGRILYTTNLKNSRGQILAHITPKVVNIVPIQQHNKNNSTNIQTVVAASSAGSASNFANKSTTQTIQRLSQPNITNIRNLQQLQATNSIVGGVANIDSSTSSSSSNNLNKILTNNDSGTATTVSGININTGNR